MTRKRRGMIIKNTEEHSVTLKLTTRWLDMGPGEQVPISAEEVRDTTLRDKLQARAISIVRPITEAEEVAVQRLLEEYAGDDG